MKRKVVNAKADNILCLLHGYRILQPHSLQPALQIVIPFEEYVYFMSGQCNSKVLLSDTLFTLDNYAEALAKYEQGNVGLIKVYYTLDCLRVGVLELKKAIARKRGATVITLSYKDVEEINFNDAFISLQRAWEDDEELCIAFKKAMSEIGRIGDATPIVLNDLNEHNKQYFSYLAYMYMAYFATSSTRRFSPINIK